MPSGPAAYQTLWLLLSKSHSCSLKETIDRQMLFDKPFTEINDEGLTGVLSMEQAGMIVSIVDKINKNAVEVG